MSEAYGATVAKRRLARRLSELRVKNGYTANQVCDKLNWGRGKVGRFEANVWKRPEMSDIRDLLRIYEVRRGAGRSGGPCHVSRGRAWWREYGDVFGDTEYPGFEADAIRIGLYMPLILPGLLQTPAYIDASLRVGNKSPAWRSARSRRASGASRSSSAAPVPELVAVITEASLQYEWGSLADRREQLAHLAAMSRMPTSSCGYCVSHGLHPGMSSLISVFDFSGDEPMVYLENDAASRSEQHEEVDAYDLIFGRIREAALRPRHTAIWSSLLTHGSGPYRPVSRTMAQGNRSEVPTRVASKSPQTSE